MLEFKITEVYGETEIRNVRCTVALATIGKIKDFVIVFKRPKHTIKPGLCGRCVHYHIIHNFTYYSTKVLAIYITGFSVINPDKNELSSQFDVAIHGKLRLPIKSKIISRGILCATTNIVFTERFGVDIKLLIVAYCRTAQRLIEIKKPVNSFMVEGSLKPAFYDPKSFEIKIKRYEILSGRKEER